MNILYINDLRMFPNWGCRATGVALSELIEKNNKIIDRIGVETGNNSGWNGYADPPIRQGGLLPKRLFDISWVLRQKLPRISKGLRLIDQFAGARHDFICMDPERSVVQFESLRSKIPRFEEIATRFRSCDAIVINGEGTLIFREPLDRDAAYLCFVMHYAKKLGKPYYLLNAMLSESPISRLNKQAQNTVGHLLEGAAAISLRDNLSQSIAINIAPRANVHLYPDALFSWKSRINDAQIKFKQSPQLSLGFGNDDTLTNFNFAAPYLCVAGTSLITNQDQTTASFISLVRALMKIGLPVLIVQTCIGDLFLDEVSQITGAPIIKYSVPVLAGAAIVANAQVFVTGRFHPSIMASCGGTPCVFMGSNSHKNKTLQEILGYKNLTHYSAAPSEDDIKQIVSDVKNYLDLGVRARLEISATVEKLSEKSKQVIDLITEVG